MELRRLSLAAVATCLLWTSEVNAVGALLIDLPNDDGRSIFNEGKLRAANPELARDFDACEVRVTRLAQNPGRLSVAKGVERRDLARPTVLSSSMSINTFGLKGPVLYSLGDIGFLEVLPASGQNNAILYLRAGDGFVPLKSTEADLIARRQAWERQQLTKLQKWLTQLENSPP